jgi:glycosyltransferase involved in cell wall biosynthesis
MAAKVLFLAPVLPSDVIATAKTFEQTGLLESLITRSVVDYANRPVSPVAQQLTSANWIADLMFYLALAFTRSRTKATDKSFALLDHFASRRVKSDLGALFAREDCCRQSFQRAREVGVPTIYQLPTAYYHKVRELMQRELSEFPDICRAANDPFEFAEERTTRKDAELNLADHVLCPSTFVRTSLPQNRQSNSKIIPFAIDVAGTPSVKKPAKPMLLYVGNITMRKGVHRLLLAWKKLEAYRTHELRLVGDMYLSEEFLAQFRGVFTHVPRVSHAELDRHYREASALVFNSVADGFGHVILEAMSAGTPVLASKNSGAPDFITDHVDGLLFNYGDEEQFAASLNWALSRPAELARLGKAASHTVRKRNWQDYGEELLAWMRPLLKHD